MPCRIEIPLTMFHLPTSLRVAALLLALPLLLSTGCTSAEVATPNPRCNDSVVACLDGKAVVSIETDKGRFTVEVDGNAAPLTSGNFVDLVQRGAYDGTVFHRVIPGFVAQGGDPASALAETPKEQYGTGNFIDPATGQSRLIPLEISLKGEDLPRYGQPVAEPGISDRVKLPHAPRCRCHGPLPVARFGQRAVLRCAGAPARPGRQLRGVRCRDERHGGGGPAGKRRSADRRQAGGCELKGCPRPVRASPAGAP